MRSTIRTTLSAFAIFALMSVVLLAGTIDLTDLFDYENQPVPNYINRDNTTTNPIENASTTLGRVLFYDKSLSSNDTVSCATCHQQSVAFSDLDAVSVGVNGITGRHSMRLINSRFSAEDQFFWDERAQTLEDQTTQPIEDHGEMGFSGENGAPDLDDLIVKLQAMPRYQKLFELAFGDTGVSEARIQLALAQFIRSIQSFDSKFDTGIAQVNGNINANFPNFSDQENQGKTLFLRPAEFNQAGVRTGGGLGCAACHEGSEFSIDPQTQNNGVITVANLPGEVDLTNTRSPTMRDIFSPTGVLNGPLMHDGSLATFDAVLDHYNNIDSDQAINPNLDRRLRVGRRGEGQQLMLTQDERDAVTAFIMTLSGNDVYTNERWSDPFDPGGTLTLIEEVLLGDVNLDGTVNFFDVPPFIGLLTTGDYQVEADVNQDDAVSFLDISPFIMLLQN